MGTLKNKKHEAFSQEYMVDRNATQAAIRAGYAPKAAGQQAFKLLKNAHIAARLVELEAEYIERVGLSVEDVLARYAEIATADARELTSFRRHACRYCHGNSHAYQWRTQTEFMLAQDVWLAAPDGKKGMPPSADGGYGFTRHLAPVPSCPMCDGDGVLQLVMPDTAQLTRKAAALFAGIKETQHGVEIKMHGQMEALKCYAEHLNIFADHKNAGAVDALAMLLAEINRAGSSAPINFEGTAAK